MADAPVLDAGTDEILRRRLGEAGAGLRAATDALDQRRRAVFGSAPTALVATGRVRTDHSCTLRDLVAIGGRLLLGFQVTLGLKSALAVDDVFAEVEFADGDIVPTARALLTGAQVERDVRDIFQYFKDARLLQLRRVDDRLLAAFQTGQKLGDVRVLRWQVERSGDGAETLRYLDNSGTGDWTFPPRHAFAWTRATREQHVHGAHGHVNILDTVFVECINGDFTIKIENNTATGKGIFSEPVKDATQGLDDAEIHFAAVEGFVLLKVRPYKENEFRYVVFNALKREAVRIDAIGDSCQLLPEGHGLVFPGGFHLATGEHKVFPIDATGMVFERLVRAPNGEDLAYVYYHLGLGQYVILRYNLITRTVEQPMVVNGHTLSDDGRLVVFRAEPEPSRLHVLQVWQTPFVSDVHAARQPAGDSFLAKLGNREVVRAVSDLYNLHRLISVPRPSRAGYRELLRQVQQALDGYHWLAHDEAGGLRERLTALQDLTNGAIDEFEKITQLAAQTAQRTAALEATADELLKRIGFGTRERLDAWIQPLAELKRLRGALETLRGERHIDLPRVDRLDARLVKAGGELSAGAARFLLQDGALAPYEEAIATLERQGGAIAAAAEAKPLREQAASLGEQLDLLVETVNGLEIADDHARTGLLDRIGGVFAALNRARAVLDARRRDLAGKEGRAGFAAAIKLLGQAAAGAITLCETPEACDEQLARLMLQIEELEGRFAELDEFTGPLAEKRIELSDAFSARKRGLLDARQRRADALASAADRVLGSVEKRAQACTTLDELNTVFASDPLVAKLRDLIGGLRAIGASVRADDGEGRLKTVRDHAVRRLRDRAELSDGDDAVRIGRHSFSVNRQGIDLTIVPRGDRLCFHVTGTSFVEPIVDAVLDASRHLWAQDLPSENAAVYRGEYLAWLVAEAAEAGRDGLDPARLRAQSAAELVETVRAVAANRHEDGYERGVHDHDAAALLAALLHLRETGGLLRFPPLVRALGMLAWHGAVDHDAARRWQVQARSLAGLRRRYGPSPAEEALAAELSGLVRRFAVDAGLTVAQSPIAIGSSAIDGSAADGGTVGVDEHVIAAAGRYLRDELGEDGGFVRSAETADIETRFLDRLRIDGALDGFTADLRALAAQPGDAFRLATAWVLRWCALHAPGQERCVPAVAAGLVLAGAQSRRDLSARSSLVVEGLLGRHPRIADGRLELRLDEFEDRLVRFATVTVPAWRAYQQRRRDLAAAERARLRVDEFKPKVLTSFVRNRLVDEVYLPLIGDNLAKQIGALGAARRTDLMGLLLLISPPGYGKTTLVEYIASVLGLAFVKINGPALGHKTTALDPAAAPDAAARQELEKLNLAFEMGDNAMIVIDDIQHCDAEFLQKFISLCDGQRRIEGVWKGQPRTYDLRGRKVAVVMAGNPYTGSGAAFKIPDMLANRADTYNLGAITGGHREAFEQSYVQNCLVVNPVLQPLASRPPRDVPRLLRLAAGDDAMRAELEHGYSALELDGVLAVLRHLTRIQQVLVQVNAAYIASAASADAYRTEPPFKLQGSYRNMARIAGKVVPAMSPDEIQGLVLDHYQGEAQTLTTAAELNLLKLREMMGLLSDAERSRWADIKRIAVRRQELDGKDDPASLAALQLAKLGEHVAGLREAVTAAGARDSGADAMAQRLDAIATAIATASAAAQAAQAAQAARPAETPKIEVINTLPAFYARLYEQNLRLIEHSLVPVIDALGAHLTTSTATRQNVEGVAGELREWLERHRQSARIDVAADQ